MQHTLAAVFDNRSAAQQAMDELINSGFPRSDITLQQTASATGSARSDDGSIVSSVKHFFHDLFSDDDGDAKVYAEAINRGNCVLTVTAASEDEVERAADIVERYGPIDIDEHSLQWRAGGSRGAETMRSGLGAQQSSAPMSQQNLQGAQTQSGSGSQQGTGNQGSMQRASVEEQAISLTQEELRLGQRGMRRGGVRIYQRLIETPMDEGISVREEVEQLGAQDDSYFRKHWTNNYAGHGNTYEEYAPAYQYGSKMAGSTQYRGRQWTEVEPELRRDWESANPGSAWEKFKASIRHGWERLTS